MGLLQTKLSLKWSSQAMTTIYLRQLWAQHNFVHVVLTAVDRYGTKQHSSRHAPQPRQHQDHGDRQQEPSGRVLPKWLHLCSSGFRKFTCVSAQISRNISMTCLLDGSRSRRSWGFPNFHGFWAAPGAIWSRLDGSTQETDCSIRNFGPCSTNSSKRIWRLPSIILLEGFQNKVITLMFTDLGGAVY